MSKQVTVIFEAGHHCQPHTNHPTTNQLLKQMKEEIMSAIDDLKREVSETKDAVSGVAVAVADVAARVAVIVEKLQNSPDAAEVAALALELDGEQTKLSEAKASLEGIAPTPTPAT